MKYYDEARMRDIRRMLAAEILKWPGAESKEMMGCLCYFRGKKFFAFLITNGLVNTKLGRADRSKLSERGDAKPFEMSGRTASTWIQLALTKPTDLRALLPYIRKSYETASD